MTRNWQFTSESVTEGHPDKLADQISDAILDQILTDDPDGRCACETLLTTGVAVVAGEITTSTYVDVAKIVRKTVNTVGYTDDAHGFAGDTCGVMVAIQEQSPDIAGGVLTSLEARTGSEEALDHLGAGDQGMMFGFAADEGLNTNLMPAPIWLAHRFAERLAEVRHDGTLPWLLPDGKTQVTVRYEDYRPVKIDNVLISTQHTSEVDNDTIREAIIRNVIEPVAPADLVDESIELIVNPSGRFTIGGPQADTGLTGRKIIVDTYGGMGRHGGGCFSGKDPTKVDRSGAYAARWVAKHVVASGVASRCEVEIAYAIGRARPVNVHVETFGTGKVDPNKLSALVADFFDLRPGAILRDLDLRRPIYGPTAAYGHFGRDGDNFTWENPSRLSDFSAAVNSL